MSDLTLPVAKPILPSEVRCPRCQRLLFKVLVPGGQIEIQCPNRDCRALVLWPAWEPKLMVRAVATT